MASSYGLGGAGLTGTGLGQKRSAMAGLNEAANLEARRNMANEAGKAAEEAGEQQLGSTLGAMAGLSVFGPIGGVLGGLAGALGASLF